MFSFFGCCSVSCSPNTENAFKHSVRSRLKEEIISNAEKKLVREKLRIDEGMILKNSFMMRIAIMKTS